MQAIRFGARVALAATFVVAAAVTRATLLTVETRWQMMAFVGLAAGYEFVARSAAGRPPRLGAFVINAGLAVLAVLLVRWHIEGLCPGHIERRCLPWVAHSS